MKTLKQNHSELASRLWAMAQVIRDNNRAKPNPEQLNAAEDLENRSMEHSRQARLFGESFLMVI